MPRSCNICSHPEAAEIDKELAQPNRVFTRIAEKYGVSDDSVRAHFHNHLSPGLAEAVGNANLEQLAIDVQAESERLFRRADEALTKMEGTNNWQAQKGFMQEVRGCLRLLSEQQDIISHATQVNILQNPNFIRFETLIIEALEDEPRARRKVLQVLRELQGE